MRFVATAVEGVFVVEREVHADARGSFERTFCDAEFADAGLDFRAMQLNLSRNPHAGTLRGMHYHPAPHAEAKLVQCVRGRILDVAIDLRRGSPTYLEHAAVELDARGSQSLFIPEGCAHGFLTLEDDSDVLYHMGSAFVAGVGAGVRWDDPAFGIAWPAAPRLISDRDAAYPDFAP
ncbi:dTDP-4-dehydrorhamnose 3,5-epimerase family protein [Glacieibacterium frigidum]|uniref:dTDP-4-dehydrorhamnose 3,5-epimerase n=1 Tax=Glacieibacterium frigidum TaxID=2593303 RepID=A0A552U9H6_9SPHN|nr:dTDP-4-dehydrorhamnose 3,5-epimerase family protein [Glacieibacterium frigidum]TRW14871.1 dTDP-4-keto-6-deoxy-D-glucose epimerase [Glacieibacterium frigidum]